MRQLDSSRSGGWSVDRRRGYGELEQLGGGSGRSARSGEPRRLLEGAGDVLVGTVHAEREVPRTFLGVGDHVGETTVDAEAVDRGRRAVERRPEQRVLERYDPAFRGSDRVALSPSQVRVDLATDGFANEVDARSAERGHGEQHLSRRRWKGRDTHADERLDVGRHRERLVRPRLTDLVEQACDLEGEQRVSRSGPVDADE